MTLPGKMSHRAIDGHRTLQRLMRIVPPIHIVEDGNVTPKGLFAADLKTSLANARADGVSGVFSVKDNLRVETREMIAPCRKSVPTANGSALLIGPALVVWLAAGALQARAAGCEACRVEPSAGISAGTARPPKTYRPLTGQERWNLYFREAFWSPGAFFRAAGPALGSHLDNDPPEWGQGSEGYGRRAANRFGRFALQETYEAAGAALLQHEVRYLRSSKTGFLPRAAHALKANFVTYDKHGRQTPHIARIGSTVAAEFTGNLWMPPGRRGAPETLRGVGMRMGLGGTFNLLREFSPELRRLLPWKKKGD